MVSVVFFGDVDAAKQRERDLAIQVGDTDEVRRYDDLLKQMGGREEYQRASQLSTSFHSTSKWVIGSLAQRGWLYGIPQAANDTRQMEGDRQQIHQQKQQQEEETDQRTDDDNNDNFKKKKRKKRQLRRATRILEVGAINTELLDAASSRQDEPLSSTESQADKQQKCKLHVRAIDIHSMDEKIEEADFLTLPYISTDKSERYDVIVCSMVLNCVTTPIQRGKMLARLFHHLRPGGLCYLTLPKFCLTKSAFLTPRIFHQLISAEHGGVGFHIEETKESPKVAFFVCRRPTQSEFVESRHREETRRLNPIFLKQIIRNKGKRFPNQFSVILDEDEVFGRTDPTLS